MGRIVSTAPASTKRARRRWRIPPTMLPPLAAVFVLAVAMAPTDWLRVVSMAVVVACSYYFGWRDGRRDLAVDLLRGGRDNRAARPAPPSAPRASGDVAPVP